MKTRRKKHEVTLCVDWTGDDCSDQLVRTLFENGALEVVIEDHAGGESSSFPWDRRRSTLLRICTGPDYPPRRLMSDIARFPGVFSVTGGGRTLGRSTG